MSLPVRQRGMFILVPRVRGPEETMPGFVRVEMEDRLAIVTINRPDALNALNSAVLRELSMTIEHLSMAADVGAIILTGPGDRAFVAGADTQAGGGPAPAPRRASSPRGRGAPGRPIRAAAAPT